MTKISMNTKYYKGFLGHAGPEPNRPYEHAPYNAL